MQILDSRACIIKQYRQKQCRLSASDIVRIVSSIGFREDRIWENQPDF